MVADFLGTKHHVVELSEEDLLAEIPETIRYIESWDITTVRASVPMFLLAKWIKKNTDITVLFSGEGSDEASGSYMYFHNAPDAESFQAECLRLIRELIYYDVLRCDKAVSGAGLEARVPFLDKEFLAYYMSIDPKMKQPRNGSEKFILRKAFDGMNLLPHAVLWR